MRLYSLLFLLAFALAVTAAVLHAPALIVAGLVTLGVAGLAWLFDFSVVITRE